MPTPTISIVLFLIASLLGALGQYLYKSGADSASGSIASYLVNPRLLTGAACYIAVMVLFVAAFKRGGLSASCTRSTRPRSSGPRCSVSSSMGRRSSRSMSAAWVSWCWGCT